MDESEIWSPEIEETQGVYLTRRQVWFVVVGEVLALFVAFSLGAGWAASMFGFNFFRSITS